MSAHQKRNEAPSLLLEQPVDVLGLAAGTQRDKLVISMRKVDGVWTIVSRYGDDVWVPTGAPNNLSESRNQMNFAAVPMPFREPFKAMMYRYLRKGSSSGRKPGASTLVRSCREMANFLNYAYSLGVETLGGITPLVCSSYLQAMRARKTAEGKSLSPGALYKRLRAVSDIYELSQYTDDPVHAHPWPDSSADQLSGQSKSKANTGGKTPLIPDNVFTTLFQRAWDIVQDAPRLLDLRDEMEKVSEKSRHLVPKYVEQLRARALRSLGYEGSYRQFALHLASIRTACYIVIASLSGCRNHEITNLRSSSYYSTLDDDGERYWWMRSHSSKTFTGDTEWMVPEAAVVALKTMDRWAVPYQADLRLEIENYRANDPTDIRIAQAQDHLNAIFVGRLKLKSNAIRTLSLQTLNLDLKAFAKSCGLHWSLASHQFRRKFANYAARSQFGDLRYLKEHYKHWTMEMTLGYAMNESQEMALYLEIQDEIEEIKQSVVASWLDKAEPLAGGYGNSIVDWRSKGENITLFRSHAAMVRSIASSTPIRSNGHAWCTAEDNLCVGNSLERTRCGDGCNNAVIGRRHAHIYRGLYDQLKELESNTDIGPGGIARVRRDVERCSAVLSALGHPVIGAAA